jgi:hypothetical protein
MRKKASPSVKSKGAKSTFTYYIPAPPHRKTGYREKEFDKIMAGILKSGLLLESIQTQAVSGPEGSGLFVIAVLVAPSAKIAQLDQEQEIHERFNLLNTHSSPDIIMDEDGRFDDNF